MKKIMNRSIYIYVLLLVVLGIITQLIPQISGALVKTEILPYDEMKISEKVTCYILRDEIVQTATEDGNINYYVGDGIKVRKNTKIVDLINLDKKEKEDKWEKLIKNVENKGVDISGENSGYNGVVTYYMDGYEGILKREEIKNLKYEDFKNKKINMINLTRDYAFKGEPIFKICKDRRWNIIYWVPASSIFKYVVGETVKVRLPKADITATIQDLLNEDDMWMVVLETKSYYEDFHNKRTLQGEVITTEYSGIKVRNSSITTEDGQAGVYAKKKNGEFVFKPIKIITSDGEYSLLKSDYFYDKDGKEIKTVEVYDEILKNPDKDKKEY